MNSKDAENKTALVTGGAGFIGSHLCERLLNKNRKVICVDDFSSSSEKNISHLLDNDKFELIEHNIINKLEIDGKIDEIYNFACPASPVAYQKNPIETIKTNVMGTINMLELAKGKHARIMQASTSEIYGDPLEHPQKESYWGNVNTLSPRSCYDEGKRCAETLFIDYNKEYGIDIKIIRIFNTYGPKMAKDDGRVVSNFIVAALKGSDITIYGDGTQTRSFQYIDDLICAIEKMMEKGNFVGPVNLGNPHEVSMGSLANKVKDMTKSKSKISYKPLPEGDPKMRQPDITLAKEVLSWSPEVSLEDGLLKTIRYFKTI